MAFVRMILPAWIAGFYAALLIVLLVFFLNPALHLDPPTFFRLLPLAAVLSVPLALLWPVLYRFARLFARRRLRVRWYSFKYLFGFAAANLILVTILYWFNGELLAVMIPPAMSARLKVGSSGVSLATVLFLTVLCWPRLRRQGEIQLACYLLAGLLPLSLAAVRTGYRQPPDSPYTAELVSPSSSAPRLLVLGIGGATLDEILPLVSQGKMPRFGRLLKQGAHGRLAGFRPCVPSVLWQSLATGKLPYKHQILDSVAYRVPGGGGEVRLAPRGLGFRRFASFAGLRERSQDPSTSRSLTLLQIWNRLGLTAREIGAGGKSPRSGGGIPEDLLGRVLDPEVPTPPGTRVLMEALRSSLERDHQAAAAGLDAWRKGEDRVVVVILPGLDRVSQFFLRYAMPAGFGNVTQDEVEKFGPVLERYYRYLDQLLGEFLHEEEEVSAKGSTAEFKEMILVVSPHGIEPLPPSRRVLERLEGNPFQSGYHGRAPDGMILAAGPDIGHGVPLGKASVLDVAPTLLYRYGLPIGMDMDGHCLTRLFTKAFISANPILLIPSYEESRIGRRAATSSGSS